MARTIKAYSEICRISNLPTVWTNVLCACVLATGSFSWTGYCVIAFALSCFYLAGMCLNDICDASHDSLCRSSRPIPSGRISKAEAVALTLSLFAAGCVVLAGSGTKEALAAALLLMAFIVWYDLDHKGTPYSVLIMAACRFMVFVVASLAASGRLPLPVVLAGALQFIYVVCISVVARFENGRTTPFPLPVIPIMLAGISLLDGIVLAVGVSPAFFLAGAGGAAAMLAGQRFVRGD